ncbi:SpoIIIAH-like family protein [Cytobacillus gottheilii]|uniref:SpoIIIAH-like family protein n=1 Tax=Cytobacillus gottheilii TaxID=859144 RepID=UPI0009B95E71|nr:SpoIIIAH-like family protein [Cytobacillus gottheilii]
MLLKKQTVWLLTMLSLVVVLSVYYITSPEQGSQDLAGVEESENVEETGTAEEEAAMQEENADATVSTVESDEMFVQLRLDLDDQRSKEKEALTAVVASSEATTAQISEAKDQIEQLNEIATKEHTLEMLIKSMNYEDVLVRAEGDEVRITVKAEEQSKAAANEIIRAANNEIENLGAVAVEFQMK